MRLLATLGGRVARDSGLSDAAAAMLTTFDRWRAVLRYHRPEQLVRRAWRRIRDAAPLPAVVPARRAGEIRRRRTPPLLFKDRPASPQRAEELRRGRLTLLNRTVQVGRPVRWSPAGRDTVDPLWEFHLQYHEFLLELAPDARPLAAEAISSWLDRYAARPRSEGWHPYCVSRRIPVWACLLADGEPEFGGVLSGRMLASLADQAHWLSGRLERDLGGNHLWENARALAIAGSFLDGPPAARWRRLGCSLLDRCIARQILPSGEHFERTPSYQADLARGLVEAALWVEPVDPAAAERWRTTARRMSRFLDAIRHPDGGVPLFGDSTLDAPESAGFGPRSAADSSGWVGDYFVHRAGPHQLVFDAGDMGPDDLPAHAHADLLTFELTAHGRRLLVDGGVYSYSGEKRNHFRGSHAHNVLIVDDRPLADVWSSFRMGRRGHVVRRAGGRTEHGVWVSATHDGYARFGVPYVHRIWHLADGGPWIWVDVVEPADDRERRLESILHISPDWNRAGTGPSLEYRSGAGVVLLESSAPVAGRPSEYSPRFHELRPNDAFAARSRCRGMDGVAWCLSFEPGRRRPEAVVEGDEVRLSWSTAEGRRSVRIAVWNVGGMGARPGRGPERVLEEEGADRTLMDRPDRESRP
jgi:uncharacterized heparinase superfamily protein